MDDQIKSAINVWARAPNSFSVSVETFAKWLQINQDSVDEMPSFRDHEVVIDSESKRPVYLNLYAAVRWCRYIIKSNHESEAMADFVLDQINKAISKHTIQAILNDVHEAADRIEKSEDSEKPDANHLAAAEMITTTLGDLLDVLTTSEREQAKNMIKDRILS
jgi:hypothetical protein